MADRICNTNIEYSVVDGQFTASLQSRPSLSRSQNSNRGGWQYPQHEIGEAARLEERQGTDIVRVESVEVYQQGNNDELFRSFIEDSESDGNFIILYDLEVENHPSYFANGVLVHNCHSFSQQASQVLLKTIEETPKHLIFILCTTEGDKIPQTIYNRCEVFEFISISVEQIIQRLEYICKQEQFKYEKEALSIIANMADGSMRQAISYLEQCSTMPITIETVKKVLCADTYDNYLNLIYAVLDDDYEAVVKLIKDVYDIDKYVAGLFSFVLDINIYNNTKNVKLISIPSVYAEDFDKFTQGERFDIKNLCEMLLDIQFEGRDNPLLKQLLIASLYREMGV